MKTNPFTCLVFFLFPCLAFTLQVPGAKPNRSLHLTRNELWKQQPKTGSSTSLAAIWAKKDPTGVAADYPRLRIFTSMLATLGTWHGVHNKLSPVLASSCITLCLSLWSPGLGQAAFCGSFAGMSSAGTIFSTLSSAGITAILFEILIHRRGLFLGLGGRLGFVAFLATNAAAILHGKPPILNTIPLAEWSKTILSLPASSLAYSAACAAIGSATTIALRESAENSENSDNDLKDPVRAAAVIGIVAALSFSDHGSLMAYGGAFTGMSLPSRLLKGVVPGRKKVNPPGAISILLWYSVAGALGGLVHAISIPLDLWAGSKWGGKAGVCAFVGVLLYRLLAKAFLVFRNMIGWNTNQNQKNYGDIY